MFQFSLTQLIVFTGLVCVGLATYCSIREVLRTEPFKQQPAFHWGENHGPKK